jgi:hypothetical protein
MDVDNTAVINVLVNPTGSTSSMDDDVLDLTPPLAAADDVMGAVIAASSSRSMTPRANQPVVPSCLDSLLFGCVTSSPETEVLRPLIFRDEMSIDSTAARAPAPPAQLPVVQPHSSLVPVPLLPARAEVPRIVPHIPCPGRKMEDGFMRQFDCVAQVWTAFEQRDMAQSRIGMFVVCIVSLSHMH